MREEYSAILAAQLEVLKRGNLELILKYPFNITLSPLQTAIARAADGRSVGDSISEQECIKYFGCEKSKIGIHKPLLVVIVAGIRGGKSLMTAGAVVSSVFTAKMDHLKKTEIGRVKIVCPKAENARANFEHLLGAIADCEALKACMVGEPKSSPHHSVTFRRPDGRRIEVSIAAADKGGTALRSGNLASYVLDEAAQFGEESSGAVVNAEDIHNAGSTRILMGGQGWIVSSPYGPTGLLYDLYSQHFGKPSADVLVVWAPTEAMNPSYNPELIASIRRNRPDVAAREYDAKWVDSDSAFFNGVLLDRATGKHRCNADGPVCSLESSTHLMEVPPIRGSRYLAAMDSATRKNAWTLVIARDVRGRSDMVARIEISLAYEWVGSSEEPLDPREVFKEMKGILTPYGISSVNCDAYGLDFIKAAADTEGIDLNFHQFSAEQKVEVFRATDSLTRQGRLSLPADQMVVKDMKAVRQKALAGSLRAHLPVTSDGRHCDYAVSVTLAVWLLGGYSFDRQIMNAMDTLAATEGGIESFFREQY